VTVDPDDGEEEEGRWQRVKRLAPSFWEKSGVQQIATTLILAEARKGLGMPPV
jgi:hypothetical protein